MNRFALPSALLLVATFAIGCEESNTPTDLADFSPHFQKPPSSGGGEGSLTSECGGSTILLDSRVSLHWGMTGAIRNDIDSPYVGDNEGVHAKIFYHDGGCSRSGDMVFDPDMQQKNGPRKLVFVFGPNNAGVPQDTPYEYAPFVNFRQLMQLGSDVNGDTKSDADGDGVIDGADAKIEWKDPGAMRGYEYPAVLALRPDYPVTSNGPAPQFRIGTSAPNCETLEYESITLERTGGKAGFIAVDRNGDGATDLSSSGIPLGEWKHPTELSTAPSGTWTVSGANARCYKTEKGKTVLSASDESYFPMPFSVTVTEVPKFGS